MSKREQRRVMVLNKVERKEMTGEAAAEVLGLSVRQVRRLLAAYRQEGVAAIAHGNRGRQPRHTVPAGVRQAILDFAQERYQGANHTHLSELLAEREGISLSRSTVRRILTAAGLRSPRKRRAPKHRQRRARYPQEGMLLQVDGSKHDWLEGRGPWLTLVGGIDDATGTVPYACFREQEDTHGYLLLLRGTITRKGRPLAIYGDRHSIFMVSANQPETLEEQLAGRRPLTQLGRALAELDIHLILAHSPQAKGRIERLWGTFQERLLLELRLAEANSIADANAVLEEFLPRFNARFGVAAVEAGSAYRPLPPETDLNQVLCFKYSRIVAADNTVQFAGQTFQIGPDASRSTYARAHVEVHERLDGSTAVVCQGRVLATTAVPAEPVMLRARHDRPAPPPALAERSEGTKAGVANPIPAEKAGSSKPAANHPWRRPGQFQRVTKSLNK